MLRYLISFCLFIQLFDLYLFKCLCSVSYSFDSFFFLSLCIFSQCNNISNIFWLPYFNAVLLFQLHCIGRVFNEQSHIVDCYFFEKLPPMQRKNFLCVSCRFVFHSTPSHSIPFAVELKLISLVIRSANKFNDWKLLWVKGTQSMMLFSHSSMQCDGNQVPWQKMHVSYEIRLHVPLFCPETRNRERERKKRKQKWNNEEKRVKKKCQ